jgi:putative ABC transport system permease protein
MKTWSLALRNLLRNRRRSVATLLALAIGTASILIFGGYSTNIKYSMQTGFVREGGHLQVQHRDYYLFGSGNPTAYAIADYEALITAIKTDDVLKTLVTVVTPTLQFGGVAGNFSANVSRTVLGTGFVAQDVSRLRLWNQFELPISNHAFALDGAADDAAIVGFGLARVLQLCTPLKIENCPVSVPEKKQEGGAMPQDLAQLVASESAQLSKPDASKGHIELLAGHANGAPNVTGLTVLKAEGQGFKELDEVAMILSLKKAQQLVFGRSTPKATSIIVQLQRTEQIPMATERLELLLKQWRSSVPLVVLDFKTLNPFYVQTLQLFNTIFGFIFALIGSIVIFTVSNTMNTAVVERTVEIGTLRAVGLRQSGIRQLFVIEGFLLGLAGAVLGAVLGLALAAGVNLLGLSWLPPGASERLPLILTIWGETAMLLSTTVGLILIAVLSAWWPAYRAARLSVVDALRHV